MAGNPPADVQQYGQSIWYDNIRRGLIESGELKKLVDGWGVVGVTSNPAIFQKAIGASYDYDDAMMHLLELEPYDIYERLAIEDIQNALDLFRPIYDRTNGLDGYVSLEVSPLIANDTATTVAEARRLFAAVNRPNVMIKIPATEAGIPAIEEAIAAGININVTLIFAVKNYEQVAEAYIRGLERRLAAGGDITHIASVASFFLSRIDSVVDRMLENNIKAATGRDISRVTANNRLKGKAAIANAKMAYKRFMQLFYGERFAALKAAGAKVQRPLWASTGTKNPAYPDTMYLDGLIGRDTVNTVPPDTLAAFKDHGTVAETLIEGLDEAEHIGDMLAEVGIDLDNITRQLQVDGVEQFIEAFENLLDQVDAKRNVLATGVMKAQEAALGIYGDAVKSSIKDMDNQKINPRLWGKDGSIWKDHGPTIARIESRLGWLDVFSTIDRTRLAALQVRTHNGVYDDVVLLGMGGSSLAPEVFNLTFGAQRGYPRLHVLDSTDPTSVRTVEEEINLPRTLFIVSSKSGGTIETLSMYHYFFEKCARNGQQFMAITDPGSDLEKWAQENKFGEIYLNPADIGGRYSALSYFGLVPAALLGLDLGKIWESAERMGKACGTKISSAEHPGLFLGAVLGVLGLQGRDKVSLHTSPTIYGFGQWLEQLIAESTGKEGRGILPVAGATVGKPHDYSTDRLFIVLRVDDDDNAELDAGIKTLQEAGHPCVILKLRSAYDIAGEFFRWEYATAIAGKLLDINPFDEPNVTESKINTGRLLEHFQTHGSLPSSEAVLTEGEVSLHADPQMVKLLSELSVQHNYNSSDLSGLLAAQINSTRAGDYFAILAYLPSTPEITEALESLRRQLRHTTKRAVTVGYGPRFLHSTGQLHKGGANNGVFILITHEDAFDIAIPGAPYGFSTLKAAQAAGDLEALQSKDRRSLRLHIAGDILQGLEKIQNAIDAAAEKRL